MGDIVVTARQRNETLISTPVAVSAVSAATLRAYGTTDIRDITKLTSSLSISKANSGGAGTIALRGISTSPLNAGFEQAVSINLDGVQTSRGRILAQGLFDVDQIEVLKGPQALFFGKNSPAGVISIRTAGPTDKLEAYVSGAYEFVGDEAIVNGAVSGPLGEDFGARVAVQYRNLDGYFRNTAVQLTSTPFLNGPPLPTTRRPGDNEVLGRVTFAYKPAGSGFDAVLKLSVDRYRADDALAGTQVINCGAYPYPATTQGPLVRLDTNGDCKLDKNYVRNGLQVGASNNWPDAKDEPYSKIDTYFGSLTMNYKLPDITLTSVTGYINNRGQNQTNVDYTSFSVINFAEHDYYHAFSQEYRALSSYDGPLNFLIGAYYQKTKLSYANNTSIAQVPPDPATGKFESFDKPGGVDGRTYSAFGQLLWKVIPTVELSAGVRYTNESKNSFVFNRYVNPVFKAAFVPQGKVLYDRFRDSNYSPEVTLTWRPTPELTAYASYKTGYKSGGLGISAVLTPATATADTFNFDSEKVKGFEGGVKAQLLDRRLTLTGAIYSYNYSNLQVQVTDPVAVSFIISNAASARVKGVELEASFRPVRGIRLNSAISYNSAKYTKYLAGCYGGQTFAQGCNVLTGNADGIAGTADDRFSQDLSGYALARAPKWSLNNGFDLTIPVGGFSAGVSGNSRYTSRYYAIENANPGGLLSGYWLFDLAARVGPEDERWQVSVIGRNLTNKYYTYVASEKPGAPTSPGIPTQVTGQPDRGRQILLQFRVRY